MIHAKGIAVKMIDPSTNKIHMIFECIRDAYEYLGVIKNSRINYCCRSTNKISYGFKWEMLKKNENLDMFKDKYFIYMIQMINKNNHCK